MLGLTGMYGCSSPGYTSPLVYIKTLTAPLGFATLSSPLPFLSWYFTTMYVVTPRSDAMCVCGGEGAFIPPSALR